MSATIASSVAILKRMFPKGELPNATYTNFPGIALAPKMTELGGDDYQSSLQNENPQAAGSNYGAAADSFTPGVYNRFLITRIKHYSLARIQGDAMEAARMKGEMAMIDLWENETQGASTTEMKCEATYFYGDGSGTLGKVLSTSDVTTATISLSNGDDIINFDLGMQVVGVTDATLSPTLLGGKAKITGISRDPDAPSLTVASAWNGLISGITAGSTYLCRFSDNAVAGAATVVTGMRGWVPGGATPGTLFGLQRNSDPVRLAGQSKDYTGAPMEEAYIDAEARLGFQGSMTQGKIAIANNRDLANLKKGLGAKVMYDRVKSAVAGLSFKSIELEGDYGPIKLVADPFCPRNKSFMGNPEVLQYCTMGAMPRILDFDGNKFLRIATDDAYEVRFGMYGFLKCKKPSDWFQLTGFGAS